MAARSACRSANVATTSASVAAASSSSRASTRSTTEPARDSPSIRPPARARTAWRAPGRGSGRSRWPLRRTSIGCSSASRRARVGGRAAAWRSCARVDSAPWFSLRPSTCRPSQPPPVAGRRAAMPASLSPRNQPTARSTAAAQRGSPVSRKARAQASASAATSIGCWSKPGRRSPSDQPPTGVTDRWPSARLEVEQPAEQRQAVVEGRARRRGARRRRGAPRGGPRWRRSGAAPAMATGAAGRASDRRATADGEQRPGGGVVGRDGEHLGRAERGEGHRPAVPAPPAGAVARSRRRLRRRTAPSAARAAAVPRPQSARPQQSSTPASSVPAPVDAEAVVAPPVGGSARGRRSRGSGPGQVVEQSASARVARATTTSARATSSRQ